MAAIWLAGAENPALHAALTLEGAAKVAVNIGSLKRNYPGFKGLALDPSVDLEWLAWSDDDDVTLEDLLKVTQLIGKQSSYAVGPKEWDTHPNYLSVWDGLEQLPVAELARGLVLTDRAFRVPEVRSRALSGRKVSSVFGVITGRSRELEGFDIILNTSWYNVAKLGELHVWNPEEESLFRHSAQNRDDRAIEHQESIRYHGVSLEEVMRGDADALLSLSLRSWLAYSDYLDRRNNRVVPAKQSQVAAIPVLPGVVQTGSGAQLPAIGVAAARHMIPTMALGTVDEVDPQGKVIGQVSVVKSVPQSVRTCNNCNLAQACPAFAPGSSCNFSMPVEIRTVKQREQMQQAMIELQTQRVFQGRLAEELLGQGLDPQVGKEMTRLFDLINRQNRDNDTGLKLVLQGKGQAGAAAAGGILSTLFGQRAAELPQRTHVGNVTAPTEQPVDVEIVDEGNPAPSN